jgi:hypothetical protein
MQYDGFTASDQAIRPYDKKLKFLALGFHVFALNAAARISLIWNPCEESACFFMFF